VGKGARHNARHAFGVRSIASFRCATHSLDSRTSGVRTNIDVASSPLAKAGNKLMEGKVLYHYNNFLY